MSTKQEYDDNNYFDADYICSVEGMDVDWGSWHTQEMFPDLVKEVKELIPANSFRFITDTPVDEAVLKKIDDLKEKDDWKYDTELVDLIIHCIKNKIDLDEVALQLKQAPVY